MGQSIKEVMSVDPITVTVSTSLQETARTMRDSDIGDVIVLDDSNQICGIVTDRDIAVRATALGKDPRETAIGEICSRDVHALTPDDEVGDAIRLMREKAIRRLPVVANGRPVGIVSIGDLAVTRDPESALADISASPPNE